MGRVEGKGDSRMKGEEDQLSTFAHLPAPIPSNNCNGLLLKNLSRHLGSSIEHWEGAISFWTDFDGAIPSWRLDGAALALLTSLVLHPFDSLHLKTSDWPQCT